MNGNVAWRTIRREETYKGRYLRGLKNQNGEHLVNLCKSKIIKTQVNQAELYFLLKAQIAKTKISHHRVVGDESIWEGILFVNACSVSQSLFYQVLNAVSDNVFMMEK